MSDKPNDKKDLLSSPESSSSSQPLPSPRFREVIIERRTVLPSRSFGSPSRSDFARSEPARSDFSRSGPARSDFSRPGASKRPPPRGKPKRPPPPKVRPEDVAFLARKCRVPQRIARRELEGELTCADWRLQNPDDAARFDRVYALVEGFPGMTVDEAVKHEQVGDTVESLRAAAAEKDANERLREARKGVSNAEIEAFRQHLIDGKVELSVVLADRVLTDRLVKVGRLSMEFAEAGEIPSIDVVALAPTAAWAAVRPIARFDEKLMAAPAPVSPIPSRRAAADPRPFLALVGGNVTVTLRMGVIVTLKVAAAGPYDLVLGEGADRLLVPMHALAAWAPA